ncbi:MAG: ribonuclease Y [Lentisphaerae bacterium]|nr:ribonuclease Y [Lentisphaerota bacterium]
MYYLAVGVGAIVVGAIFGYLIRLLVARSQVESIEGKARQLRKEAKREAESILKEAEIQAKAEVLKAREEFEVSTKTRQKELAALEERISQRETNLDRKVAMIDKKEHNLSDRMAAVEQEQVVLKEKTVEFEQLILEEKTQLQRVAGMTQEEAKETLLARIEKEVHGEMGGLIRRLQEQAKDTAEREAQRIVAMAIQRYSGSHANEIMTSTVTLPGDDMKGRIIGRDGRNIRALESVTGVNIMIDDTPQAVVISGFDPIRREIAKLSLESLMADGRIHPARIEEVVKKVEESMEETIRKVGEEAAYVSGVQGISPDMLSALGRLKYRTSYSQNVLQHSIEVSHLMGVMAGEMGLDVALAKRIGLFHDIGKSLDHEVEGGHAVIGADLLKRHGEDAIVVNATAAHHEEVPAESLYAVLAAAADAISSSRLGARSETTEIYVKRLEQLEEIANGFEGVKKSYAIQAGREVRVIVDPESVDDNGGMVMARNISKKIEENLQYPGQIRVIVIRETRSVEYAR